ncbi:transglycosylase SLT domain-containing protein [Cyanobium sp. Morenito 9A2]|nr:transglycosylase SLT domain-containing protein [Cyanobium sp. Morenito 9A2]
MLIALTCAGSLALLLAGRWALQQRAALTPASPGRQLSWVRHGEVDPQRRREASLLLVARAQGDPKAQRRLLAGQGWGSSPLAAVALKLQALATERLGRGTEAKALWGAVLQRFPQDPASADALYALGRQTPTQRLLLLRRFPAHPAALAAAVELGPSPGPEREGALHLARWGPRWPGAEPRLRHACSAKAPGLTPGERRTLALAFAELGDGATALDCLGPEEGLVADGAMTLGKALLKADAPRKQEGERRLLALAQRWPQSPQALEATRLLSQQDGPTALARLAQLPARLRATAPVQARLVLEQRADWRTVLRRWPRDPASWDLQWELARERLLKGQWTEAAEVLRRLEPAQLAAPLAARQQFWLGYVLRQLGQEPAARTTWEQLLQVAPNGYYGWRAALQLGQAKALKPPKLHALAPTPWRPLASGGVVLDELWRLDQPLEAWERWRDRRRNQPLTTPAELGVEGRLRQGVGDDWTGLVQLEQAHLRLPAGSCQTRQGFDHDLHPVRFERLFLDAGLREQVDPALLLAVALQESRFTPAVRSSVGAVGLMQLMPETAAELAGRPLSLEALKDPVTNVPLGARYLRHLLARWQDNPLLAVASYNAGPGAVEGWISPLLRQHPELWVEAIPYPETRLYVKKVLGNRWSYLQRDKEPSC